MLVGHHNTVHLLGHSLGARVCLGTLVLLPRPIGVLVYSPLACSTQSVVTGQCFLVAAAVGANALGMVGQVSSTSQMAGCRQGT